MASQAFQYFYTVTGGMSPGPLDITGSAATGPGYELVENAGDGDGVNSNTVPGQPIDQSPVLLEAPLTFVAMTAAGDPIISDNSGVRYVMSNDPALGAQVTPSPGTPFIYCFAPGTLIGCDSGEVAVQNLSIGDLVLTEDGRAVPVKWIGRQVIRFRLGFTAKLEPVRIKVGALGAGLPHSDLTVSADHGILIDGLVINASALVNHSTVNFVPVADLAQDFTYYHVETEDHDVILANGVPAETFVDIPGRRAFDNHGEYLELYGAERMIPEMNLPRITSQRMLPDAIRMRLGMVAEIESFGATRVA